MIKNIELENYRCYVKHKIEFKDLAIIVGKNNAGKSTLIEALRLISLVTNRYKNVQYKLPPSEFGLHLGFMGITLSIKGIEISVRNIFHFLGSPPAKITVNFENKTKIQLFIGEDFLIHAVIFDEAGKVVKNKIQAKDCHLPEINILPQIGPLKEKEDLLDKEYIKANIYSNLASSHFRNQLQYFEEYYNDFCKLTHETWQSIRIREFIKGDKIMDQPPALFIEEDGKFVAEIGWLGHGIQMWIQTMWFIARCKKDSTVILDEPDVYLHADLQRKLIRFLKNRFRQIIVATHSIEIMSEVDPDSILVVDKSKTSSKYSTSLPAVQDIINNIGSIHNLELMKCWSSRKFIILEGPVDDMAILKIIQDKLFPSSDEPLSSIPKIHVGGWGGWQKVIGSKLALKNIKDISIYCIFDSDYHLDEEKLQRVEDAKKEKINLHIWSKKEIENYLIVPAAILRFISNKCPGNEPSLTQINDKIEELILNKKDDITDCYSNEVRIRKKLTNVQHCNQEARVIVTKSWATKAGRLAICPGKELLGMLSDWSKNEFGVSFNSIQIARELEIEDIDDELVQVITAIEQKRSFL